MNSLYTVKKNSDFRRMYARGKSAVTSRLVVYCRKNRLDRNRTGFTVSAKLGHAVVRNRIRRQLREIVRLNSDKLTVGYDLILVARGKAVNAEYRKLEKNFLEACETLKLLKPAVPTDGAAGEKDQ